MLLMKKNRKCPWLKDMKRSLVEVPPAPPNIRGFAADGKIFGMEKTKNF